MATRWFLTFYPRETRAFSLLAMAIHTRCQFAYMCTYFQFTKTNSSDFFTNFSQSEHLKKKTNFLLVQNRFFFFLSLSVEKEVIISKYFLKIWDSWNCLLNSLYDQIDNSELYKINFISNRNLLSKDVNLQFKVCQQKGCAATRITLSSFIS